MKELQEVSPSGSYVVNVPQCVREDIDDVVTSYWIEGDDLLFQISSYLREEGDQVSASDRLKDRLAISGARDAAAVNIEIDGCPDVAAAKIQDDDGVYWTYVYAVWPWLAVFMTVSHPHVDMDEASWAYGAIRSLRSKTIDSKHAS